MTSQLTADTDMDPAEWGGTTIVVVDDPRSFADLLSATLNTVSGMRCVGSAADGRYVEEREVRNRRGGVSRGHHRSCPFFTGRRCLRPQVLQRL